MKNIVKFFIVLSLIIMIFTGCSFSNVTSGGVPGSANYHLPYRAIYVNEDGRLLSVDLFNNAYNKVARLEYSNIYEDENCEKKAQITYEIPKVLYVSKEDDRGIIIGSIKYKLQEITYTDITISGDYCVLKKPEYSNTKLLGWEVRLSSTTLDYSLSWFEYIEGVTFEDVK